MRTVALLAVVLIIPALAPAQDGDEAKKLFQAMEERLAKAKSVSLGFSIKIEAEGKKVVAMKGSLAFASGDRVRLETEGTVAGNDEKATLTSNGKRIHYVLVIKGKVIKDRETPTPKNLTAALARMFSRSGFLGMDSLHLDSDSRIELQPEKLFPITDLKLSGKAKVEGRETRVLTYKVAVRGDRNVAVTLWVDPLTHLPLKRVDVRIRDGKKTSLTALYTGIKTDE